MDRIYLIENEVNDRPLNSIICPWMLKSFTIANVDHKPKFLYSHQFWLEIYSGCHLHLFTAWLMCSSVICLKNVEWLSWLSSMGSLPSQFLPPLSNSRAFLYHMSFVCSEQNFFCTVTQERSSAETEIHKSFWDSCLPSTGKKQTIGCSFKPLNISFLLFFPLYHPILRSCFIYEEEMCFKSMQEINM